MLRCIAVDDEPLALELLRDYISKVGFLEPVAFCADGMEAVKVLADEKVDLVFLDIQMPGLTGLQLIQSVQQKPLFILITAYEQFALEGYRLNVVDYLLKPVEFSRFLQACNKAAELNKLMHERVTGNREYFFVPIEYSMVKVVFKEVLWLEGEKDYTRIHLRPPTKPLFVRMTLKSAEDELPASLFVRIHKSFIAAIDAITAIKKNSVFIGDVELPIGETFRQTVQGLTSKK